MKIAQRHRNSYTGRTRLAEGTASICWNGGPDNEVYMEVPGLGSTPRACVVFMTEAEVRRAADRLGLRLSHKDGRDSADTGDPEPGRGQSSRPHPASHLRVLCSPDR